MDEASQQNTTGPESPRENAADHASSGDESSESDGHEISQAIVEEIRTLYQCDKVEILNELIKSRIDQARLKHRVDVLQHALEESSSSKMKLQLDLAYSNRIVVCLQEAANEQINLSTKVTEKYNMAVDMMSELDLKRVQLIKDTRSLRNEFTEYQEKIEQIDKELQEQTTRAQSESNHNIQLQMQIEDLLLGNSNLKEQLAQADVQHQTLVSSHSAQLTEIEKQMTKLNEQLRETENRMTREIQTNNALKENIDAVLADKLHISMELTGLEIKMAEKENEMESKLKEMEKSCQILHSNEIKRSELKCSELNEEIVGLNGEIKALSDSIEKLRAELMDSNNKVNDERNKSEELENKVGGMQAILEDRNKEIYSLHAKLNGEQKRFEELRQQMQQKSSEMQVRLESIQSQSELDKNKIAQLETDLANYVSKLSIVEDELKLKDEELLVLKDKLSCAEQTKTRVVQIESELANQTSKVNCTNTENARLGSDSVTHATLQVTSTPFRPIELSCSSDDMPAKKPRASEVDDISIAQKSNCGSSNYSSFQQSVLRKRTAQYKFFGRKSPNAQSRNSLQLALPIGNKRGLHESLNISDASTINIDDEPTENANISSNSSIRFVKPFFRKNQD